MISESRVGIITEIAHEHVGNIVLIHIPHFGSLELHSGANSTWANGAA